MLFTFDENLQEVIFNKQELLTTHPFKKILKRDHGSSIKGSRRKDRAYNELAYIYFMADWESPAMGMVIPQRDMFVKRLLRIDEKWKPDDLILEGITMYQEVQLEQMPSLKVFYTLRKGMRILEHGLRVVIDDIEHRVMQQDEMSLDQIALLEERMVSLMNLADKVPTSIDKMEKIEDKVRTEKANSMRIRGDTGGRGLGNREDVK